MKSIAALLFVLALLASCSPTGPKVNQSLTIDVSGVAISSRNEFTATVEFTNNLGRDINIRNLGCMAEGRPMPSFVLERLEDSSWISVGAPLCVELYLAPSRLSDGGSLNAAVRLPFDSAMSGTFRLTFDICEANLGSRLPAEYLASGTFRMPG